MDEIRAEILALIAQLDCRLVSSAEIGMVTGLDPEQVDQIKETEQFLTVKARITAEQAGREDMLNKGWDMVEERALNGLLEQIEAIPDPDFMLKAAAMANKATRRGAAPQRVINGDLNGHAVVQLPSMFVQHIQQGGFSIHQTNVDGADTGNQQKDSPPPTSAQAVLPPDGPTKRFNALQPSDVEGLLGDSMVDAALGEINFSVALEES